MEISEFDLWVRVINRCGSVPIPYGNGAYISHVFTLVIGTVGQSRKAYDFTSLYPFILYSFDDTSLFSFDSAVLFSSEPSPSHSFESRVRA